jgi:outer membrane protein
VVENERSKAHLQLLRAMGLNLATELELTDKLSYEPVDAITVEQAESQPWKNRPDVKAQAEREAAARLNANAVKAERLPSLVAYADYGTTGVNGNTVALLPTRDYGVSLRVPIFDGGRRDARRAQKRPPNSARSGCEPTTCTSRSSWRYAWLSTACIPPRSR